MPQSFNQKILDCYELAAECRRCAEAAATTELRAEFLDTAQRLIGLAHSYEFTAGLAAVSPSGST